MHRTDHDRTARFDQLPCLRVGGATGEIGDGIDRLAMSIRQCNLVCHEVLAGANAFGESCLGGCGHCRVDRVASSVRKRDQRGGDVGGGFGSGL